MRTGVVLLFAAAAAAAMLAQPPDARTRPEASDTASQLSISDDAGGSPLFRATRLGPGSGATNCVQVRYQGAYPGATLGMYATVSGAVLPSYLELTVEVGQGGRFGSCASFTAGSITYDGTLADFAASHGDPTVPLTMAPLDGDGTVSFRLRVQLADAIASMGTSAGATFGWVAEQGTPPAVPLVPSASPSPSPSAAPSSTPSFQPTASGSPQPAPGPVETPSRGTPARSHGHGLPLSALAQQLARLAQRAFTHVLVPAGKAGSISLVMLAVVALFLLVQNRLDRRDPKLAEAPVRRSEDLEFVDRSEVGP